MIVKLKDVLEIAELSEIKQVAGTRDLDRNVIWAHVVEYPGFIEWLQGGELLFTTGVGIPADMLVQLVRECSNKNVAGLIISVGRYIPQTPEDVIKYADELGFPIFEAPWKVRLIKVISAIYNFIDLKRFEAKSVQDILENILHGRLDNPENLTAITAASGYEWDNFHQIMVIKFMPPESSLNENETMTQHQRMTVESQMRNIISEVFERIGKKILMLIRLNIVIIMMPTLKNEKERRRTKTIAEELLRLLPSRFKEFDFSIGWGKPFFDIDEAPKSLSQAEKAIRVAQSDSSGQKYRGYSDLGFYKVLFSVRDKEELEEFRDEILGSLLEYDENHRSDLINTLALFCEESGNCSHISERLFIHRNTLQYRLQKISDITGRDLNVSDDRMHLYQAILVHKYLSM